MPHQIPQSNVDIAVHCADECEDCVDECFGGMPECGRLCRRLRSGMFDCCWLYE